MSSSDKRRKAELWGRHAETLAALYLMLKGYRIVLKRFRVKGGEIDLVAKRGKLVIFVEVKARMTTEDALLAIDSEKRQRMAAAARAFVRRYPGKRDYRADALLMRPWRWPVHESAIMPLDLA